MSCPGHASCSRTTVFRANGTLALLIAAYLLLAGCSSSRASGVGQRFSLTSALQLTGTQAAQVFVPDYYVPPADGQCLLLVHLHGAVSRSEDIAYRAQANAIVFGLHLDGLSGVYQTWFSDPAKLANITNLVLEVLRTNNIMANPQIDKLVLSSFSAGYAGIREILKSPAYYQRTDALLLGDTLYSSSDPATRTVQMRDFLQFAIDARDGRKHFLLTHSSVVTYGYDSTVQTADYLGSGIGSGWAPVSIVDEIGTRYRQNAVGNFEARGYLGEAGADHTAHYLNMHLMMARMVALMETNQPSAQPRFKSITKPSSNTVLLELEGSPAEYLVETSADFTGWVPLAILNVATRSALAVDGPGLPATRLYRARTAMVRSITGFEPYAAGTAVMFQPPSYSGSTSSFLDTSVPSTGWVTNSFPPGGQNGARVYQSTWSFKPGQTNPWLRLTTFNAPNLPNPAISLTGALRFDIYSTRAMYVTLGIRETATTAAIGGNGGTSGGIEWVGSSTANSNPPLGRLVPANTWTRLVFFLPQEPVGNFAGNGVLSSSNGRGTLEHLALVPADLTGPCTVFLDNLAMIE